jgi:hypothetical protein
MISLTFCFDGSLPYTVGFNSLITGEPLPDPCFGCTVAADEQWVNWLQARQDRLGGNPEITRIGMQGDYVLMKAAALDGRFAVECLFRGSSPVQLLTCQETELNHVRFLAVFRTPLVGNTPYPRGDNGRSLRHDFASRP